MAASLATVRPVLAVFASDKGPGDPERASIMSQAGTLLARRGAAIVCLAENLSLPVPLITSARAAGGEVTVIGDSSIALPAALSGVPLETIARAEDRMARVSSLANAYVGLPGSLASVSMLYRSWVRGGGTGAQKPVILLNRNKAFEPLRGLSADVLSHSVKRYDRMMVFTDSIEDLPNRVAWALSENGQPSF